MLISLAAVTAGAGTALAQQRNAQPYREHVPYIDWKPDVTGDIQHTGTYQYWKDRKALNPDWVASKEHQWQLNWKFMDPSYDDTLHGGHIARDRGAALYKKLDAGGAFAACLGARNGDLKGLRANHYPQYSTALGRVVGLEEMIEHCAARQNVTLENGSYDNSAISVYVTEFSNGMPINIDVSKGPLKDAFERGRERFHLRNGATHFACATCHVTLVGRSLRGQVLTTPYGDAAHWPTYRTKDELQSLHVRFAECNRNAGAQPLRPGSPVYSDIEVFLTALSNGYPVDVPSARD
ncbi:MAG: sulfur oxidation c-type cytochrome SoxA [Betaproteobacteria bacterium CG2_30_68_42]|nr:MAG: sulfur oxidation c-type cytochrome SoxA [Betaproteobacteria bacterium CG2_30_68_42]